LIANCKTKEINSLDAVSVFLIDINRNFDVYALVSILSIFDVLELSFSLSSIIFI